MTREITAAAGGGNQRPSENLCLPDSTLSVHVLALMISIVCLGKLKKDRLAGAPTVPASLWAAQQLRQKLPQRLAREPQTPCARSPERWLAA